MKDKYYKLTNGKNQTFQYHKWEWNLAWFLMFLGGVLIGYSLK